MHSSLGIMYFCSKKYYHIEIQTKTLKYLDIVLFINSVRV